MAKQHKKIELCRRVILAWFVAVILANALPVATFVSAETSIIQYSLGNPDFFGYSATGKESSYDNEVLTWKIEGVKGLGSLGTVPTYSLTFFNKTDYEAKISVKVTSISKGTLKDFNGNKATAGQTYEIVVQPGLSASFTFQGEKGVFSAPIGTATFSNITLTPTSRDVKAFVNDAAMGSATASSESAQLGTTVTFHASAIDGFRFVHWKDGTGKVVSTQKEFSYTVTDTIAFTAFFEPLSDVHVNVNILQDKYGTVSIGNTAYGSSGTFIFSSNSGQQTLHAEPQKGYVFYGWVSSLLEAFTEDAVVVSTATDYSIDIAEEHHNLTAIFLRENAFSVQVDGSAFGSATLSTSTGVLYETVTFSATPSSGYVFDGWYDEQGNLYSADATYEHKITVEEDLSLTAHFRTSNLGSAICALYANTNDSGTPVSTYADLQEGLNAAAKGSNKIVVLLQKVELAYNLVIPSGVTLVVPYGESDRGKEKVYGSEDTSMTTAYAASLTVPNGKSVVVKGTLLVNAVQGVTGTYYSGSISGTYGLIELEGELLVESGGVLKARGLIVGTNGMVRAKSGSVVYQLMEMADWRGGSKASSIYSYLFPINTFYLQNIQTTTEYLEGCTLKAYYYVNVTGAGDVTGSIALIENSASALFRIGNNGKIVFKYQKYDSKNNVVAKSVIDVYGFVYAQYTSLYVDGALGLGYLISTENVQCPLSGAFELNIMDGGHLTIEKHFRLLPGAMTTIHEGGEVTIAEGGNLYLYDLEDFDDNAETGFCYKGYRRLPMSSGAIGVLYDETEDARLVINGTLNVKGGFYCSFGLQNGSNGGSEDSVSTTSPSGKIVVSDSAKLSNTTIYEFKYTSASANEGDKQIMTFVGARGYLVGGWAPLAVGTTYYSNGSEWYTYAVQYQNSNGAPIEEGTFYFIGSDDISHPAPSTGLIPNRDGTYIYGERTWNAGGEGVLSNGCSATIFRPAEATPIGLDSSLELEYRLNDYIWLNAKVYSPAAGTAKLVDANGTELADFSLVPLNNGYYYIIRKVTSTELVTPYTVYLQIDGLKTEALSVGFQAYKESIYSTADQATKDLLDAMLVYGEAAEDKFVGANSTTATVTKPNVSGAHTDMNLDRGNVIITQDVHAYGYGVNLNFDNCIRFIYGLQLEGMTDAKWANVVQIGLIRADKTAGDLFAEGSAAYVLYHNTALSQNSANLPEFGLATNGTDATLSFDAVKAMWNSGTGILEISYDMLYEDYNTVYTYRPYVMFKVGDELVASYGEQFDYGLETYLANRIDKSEEQKEQNLLYATWNYMKAVKAWMA